jgi:hypothetical protein
MTLSVPKRISGLHLEDGAMDAASLRVEKWYFSHGR